jgi:hypothetical protein
MTTRYRTQTTTSVESPADFNMVSSPAHSLLHSVRGSTRTTPIGPKTAGRLRPPDVSPYKRQIQRARAAAREDCRSGLGKVYDRKQVLKADNQPEREQQGSRHLPTAEKEGYGRRPKSARTDGERSAELQC